MKKIWNLQNEKYELRANWSIQLNINLLSFCWIGCIITYKPKVSSCFDDLMWISVKIHRYCSFRVKANQKLVLVFLSRHASFISCLKLFCGSVFHVFGEYNKLVMCRPPSCLTAAVCVWQILLSGSFLMKSPTPSSSSSSSSSSGWLAAFIGNAAEIQMSGGRCSCSRWYLIIKSVHLMWDISVVTIDSHQTEAEPPLRASRSDLGGNLQNSIFGSLWSSLGSAGFVFSTIINTTEMK